MMENDIIVHLNQLEPRNQREKIIFIALTVQKLLART